MSAEGVRSLPASTSTSAAEPLPVATVNTPVPAPPATPVSASPAATAAAPQVTASLKAKPDEFTVNIKKDAVIGIRLDQAITSESARVDDRIAARVARDVVVDGRTAIPAGARLEGVVTLVERGGHLSDRGKLGIRFTTLVLSGITRLAIQTETIFRESEPVGEPAAALGGSAALGAMLSSRGRPGAPVPTPGGAPAVGTGAYKQDARISSGSPLTVRLVAPLSIVIEK